MKDDQWPQVKKIFDAAIQCTPEKWPALLDQACGADLELRASVQSLLDYDLKESGFLERPAMEVTEQAVENDSGLQAGDKLEVYRVIRKLGKGGMAAVYLATDPRFPRQVALKVLPQEVTADADSLHRFKQESRAASALNHPNIITIFDVGCSRKTHYIVTEFVDGETLRERLARSPMTVEEAVDLNTVIASALKVAHAAGIVHRDIKPENIMIRRDGLVKILDFGIAKLLSPSFDGTQSSTIMRTVGGLRVGTPSYMSQEQWSGDKVDARTDLFSLGAVLYECLTGKIAFPNGIAHTVETPSDTLKLPSQVNSSVPAELDRVVLKLLCVRENRYGSADELLTDLSVMDRDVHNDSPLSNIRQLFRYFSLRIKALPIAPFLSPRYSLSAIVLLFVLAATADVRPKTNPTAYADWYKNGTEALRDGAYEQARINLEKAIQAGVNLPLAHARLAETYLELDNKGKAKDELDEVTKLAPDLSSLSKGDSLYVEAVRAIDAGEYPRAIDRYREIMRLSPNEAYPYLDLGRAYEKHNQSDLALTNYKEAANRNRDYATAYLRQGILYGQQNQHVQSDDAFKTADDVYQAQGNIEGRANVHFQRAMILLNAEELTLARTESQQALDLARAGKNKSLQMLSQLQLSSNLTEAGDIKKAQELASQALDTASREGMQSIQISALIDLGNAVFAAKGPEDLSKAEQCFDDALNLAVKLRDPRNEAIARFSLGSVRAQRSVYSEAVGDLEKAQAFFVTGKYRSYLEKTLTVLGQVKRDLGAYDDALQTYGQLLKLSKEDNQSVAIAAAHTELGKVFLAQEEYPSALAAFDESFRLGHDSMSKRDLGYLLMNRARALWQLGRYSDADNDFKKAQEVAINVRATGLTIVVAKYAAQMELSRGRLDGVRKRIQQFSGSLDSRNSEADRLTCLVRVLSNDKSGLSLCQSALDAATKAREPLPLSRAQLSYATALLESREWQRAVDLALEAGKTFGKAKQLDSLWRAYLIAGLGCQDLHRLDDAHNYANQAYEALTMLEHKWGKQETDGYLRRPDIRLAVRQLSGLAAKPLAHEGTGNNLKGD